MSDPEIQKGRSTRTGFFTQMLKRPSTQPPQSIRYEDIPQRPEPADSSIETHIRILPGYYSPDYPHMSRYSHFSSPGGDNESPLIIRFYDPKVKARDARGRTLDELLRWSDAQLEYSHNYIQILFPLPEGSPFNYAAPIVDREVMEAFHSRADLRNGLRKSFERMLQFYGFAVTADPEREENEQPSERDEEVDRETSAKPEGDDKVNKEPAQEQVATSAADEAEEKFTSHATSKPSPDKSNVDAPRAAVIPSKVPSKPLIGFFVVRGPHWQEAFGNWAIRFDHNHLRITRILRCLRVLGLQTECEAFYKALKHVYDDPNIHINERSMSFWRKAIRQPLHIAPDGERIPWLQKWEQEKEKGEEENGREEEERKTKKAKNEGEAEVAIENNAA